MRWKPSLKKDSCNAVREEQLGGAIIAYLLVNVELAEDLGGVEQVSVVDDPTILLVRRRYSKRIANVLLDVPGQERQVEDQRDPVSVDEEEEGQETVNGGLGDDVGVESVAEINGVDVIAVENNISS